MVVMQAISAGPRGNRHPTFVVKGGRVPGRPSFPLLREGNQQRRLSLSVPVRPRVGFTRTRDGPPDCMATERTLPERLGEIERWRYQCPMGHNSIRSMRGGEAVYCKSCDLKWELHWVLDKKTGQTVR